MNQDAFFATLGKLERGELRVSEARRELLALGGDPQLVEEDIFISLGGSDVVETGKDGLHYCIIGDERGRTVEDIERQMRES